MHLPLNTSGESHVVLLCAGRLCPECGPSVWAAAHPLWQHAARHAARQHILPAGSGSALCASPQSAHAAPQRPTIRTCLLPNAAVCVPSPVTIDSSPGTSLPRKMSLCCQRSPEPRPQLKLNKHASAAAQIPSQGYGHPPGNSPPPPSRVYTGQPLGMLGAPSELPSYTPAVVPHSGAWQHESPPSTPKLQVTEPRRYCLAGTLLLTARYNDQGLPLQGGKEKCSCWIEF